MKCGQLQLHPYYSKASKKNQEQVLLWSKKCNYTIYRI